MPKFFSLREATDGLPDIMDGLDMESLASESFAKVFRLAVKGSATVDMILSSFDETGTSLSKASCVFQQYAVGTKIAMPVCVFFTAVRC